MSKRSEGRAVPVATSNAHKRAGNWAGSVSRTLRAGGMQLRGSTERLQQGMRVKASEFGRCRVVADFDDTAQGREQIERAAAILRAAGYTVEEIDNHPVYSLHVTRPEAPAAPAATTPGGNKAPEWKRRPKNVLGQITWEHRWFPGWVVVQADAGYAVEKLGRKDLPEAPFATLNEATNWIEANK